MFSVTLINEYAFALCTGITELTLYEGLTNIADYAFYNCASLNKVISLATTAPYFGSNVFDNISSDAALFCPTESEEDYIEKGWDNYFSINASDINGGQCGENITWLFTPTTGELKITGTGEMWDYEDYESSDERTPWNQYSKDIKSLILSEGITHIGSNAFRGLTVGALVLPSTTESIGRFGFFAFGSDTIGTLVLPEKIVSMGANAFNASRFTGTLNIPNSVTTISAGTFSNCHFTEINLSENMTDIPYCCFLSNSKLTTVKIPAGITKIDEKAFYDCPAIINCTILATTAPTLDEDIFSSEIYENAYLYYHADATDYEEKGWFDYFANRNPIYTGTCGENAYWTLNMTTCLLNIYGTGAMNNFSSSTNPSYSPYKQYIKSVIIEEGITNVGNLAFIDCTEITEFTLASTVTSIGNYAFRNFTGLTGKIIIPSNVISIGSYAFSSCTGITGLKIEGSASIGDYAFYNCTGLQSISNSDISKLVSIGDYAFTECTGLTSIAIPHTVESIGSYAFYECTELTTLAFIPRTQIVGRTKYYFHDLSSIGNYAFSECSKLVGVTKDISSGLPGVKPEEVTALFIPFSVQTIGISAFENCTSIPELRFETGGRPVTNLLTSIGDSAFENCSNIMGDLNLSMTKLTKINSYAFYGCRFERIIDKPRPIIIGGTLSLPNTILEIEPYAFHETGFRTANFPETLTKISSSAFAGTSLTNLDLSKTNVNHIGNNAFYNVPFTDVITFRTEPASLGTDVFNAITGNIYIPYQFKEAYHGNANWSNYSDKIVNMPTYTPLTATVNHWVGLSSNFQTIDPGRGYLYASEDDVTLEFNGHLNTEAVSYNLTAQGEQLTGFHLIGNPFAHNITTEHFLIGDSLSLAEGYYVLTGEGSWSATPESASENIKPGQGVLIKTTADGELTISRQKSAADKGHDRNQLSSLSINVNNDKYSDKAFVIFNKGIGLDKINHENEEIPLLYIPVGETDFAIAMIDENANEIPVNFETNVMGEYTISLQQENCNFKKLYLLDKETKEIVNILEEDYTFIATSNDSPERFILTFENDNDNEHFAYINNGDIVIYDINALNGAADIRIIDALGRCVYNGMFVEETNRISTSIFSSGVYIIEKSDDNGINVQKIII